MLGCTHYPFIAAELRRHCGESVRFIDTGAPVALQTRRLLAEAGQLAAEGEGSVALLCSAAPEALDGAAARWLIRPPALAAIEAAA